jgi:sec-independent protein translocase protein TatC
MFLNLNDWKIYNFFFIEIKFRLFYILLSFLLCFLICFYFKEELIYILTNYILYFMSSQRFIFSKLTQILYIYLKFALTLSLFLNLPFFFFHIIYFFFSGLYFHEKKKIIYIFFLFNLNYILSIFLTYFYIFPFWLNIFLNFEKNNQIFPLHFEANLNDFFFFMFNLFFNVIFCFQIPLIIYLLIYLKIIDILFIIKNRKIFYLFCIILSACFAPPDIFNQCLIYFLFIIIYELFILLFLLKNNLQL